jgi:site-specific DNA-methyltransferase (adenine-specific)
MKKIHPVMNLNDVTLYHANSLDVMDMIFKKYPDGCFDMIFADPPYFLSNGGLSCQNGKIVSVNKGEWDKSQGFENDVIFCEKWLEKAQKILKPNGTIWVSGTSHVIYIIGFVMQKLNYKLLNNITWEKPNPPPNLSCRYFTHSTETILWAAKSLKSKHYFDYEKMKSLNGDKQMKSVWTIKPPSKLEKIEGRHPTQKPVELVERCILASTQKNDFIFDPFLGSGTTGIAALNLERRFCGVEKENEYINLSMRRINTLKGI